MAKSTKILLSFLFLWGALCVPLQANILERQIYHVVMKYKPNTQSISTYNDLLTDVQDKIEFHGGEVHKRYYRAFIGLTMEIEPHKVSEINNISDISFIEEDKTVELFEENNWGLDRIDQADLPLDGVYDSLLTGLGANLFIMDTGININHQDFSGRLGIHYSAVDDGQGIKDCNGHGTHVAGTAGGSDHGVAKKATIHAVKVFSCAGGGASTADIVEGIEWVLQQGLPRSIINMSLGAPGQNSTMETAVANAVDQNVAVAVASGNSNGNSCNFTPAREPKAVTVNASTISDYKAYFSNYGSCSDIYAPGYSILSASNESNTGTKTLSGTSMASPHVAGALALLWQQHPDAQALDLEALLVGAASKDKLSDIRSDAGDPNLLLNVINFNTDLCIRNKPNLTISPSEIKTNVGSYEQMYVTIQNNDSEACVSSQFSLNLDGESLRIFPLNPSMNVPAGQERSMTVFISSSLEGDNEFQVVASSPDSESVSRTAVWRVLPVPYLDGLNFKYYEGEYSDIPNFDGEKVDKVTSVGNVSLQERLRDDKYAIQMSGYLNVTSNGNYGFKIKTSGKARVFLNHKPVIEATSEEVTAQINLFRGYNLLEIEFVEYSGNNVLDFQWQKPGEQFTSIPNNLLYRLPLDNFPPEIFLDSFHEFRFPFNKEGELTAEARDVDGEVVSFHWEKTSGAEVTLKNQDTSTLVLEDLVPGRYTFKCTVTDDDGAQSSKNVYAQVFEDLPELVNGVSYSYYEGIWPSLPNFDEETAVEIGNIDYFSLSPRKRDENFGFVFSSYIYAEETKEETIVIKTDDGSKVFLNGTLRLKNDPPGNYYIGFRVKLYRGYNKLDFHFQQKTGAMLFELKTLVDGKTVDFPASRFFRPVDDSDNKPPVVNAGADVELKLPNNSVVLNATAEDSDGSIESTTWKQLEGPSATFTGENTKNLSLTNLIAGTYVFEFSATDNGGASASDTVQLVVKSEDPTDNQLPIANAGDDITIYHPQDEVVLEGYALDYDGEIVFASWRKISGPELAQITSHGPNRFKLYLRNLKKGVYVYNFLVEDNEGGRASDSVTIRVE